MLLLLGLLYRRENKKIKKIKLKKKKADLEHIAGSVPISHINGALVMRIIVTARSVEQK